jgi:hypothetical protein
MADGLRNINLDRNCSYIDLWQDNRDPTRLPQTMAKTESSRGEPALATLTAAAMRQANLRDAAYRVAWDEIESLEPGEVIQYHEGNLAADVTSDPEVAGRAAAYRHAATDLGKGALAQRRIGFEWYQYLFRRSDA